MLRHRKIVLQQMGRTRLCLTLRASQRLTRTMLAAYYTRTIETRPKYPTLRGRTSCSRTMPATLSSIDGGPSAPLVAAPGAYTGSPPEKPGLYTAGVRIFGFI